MKKKRNTFKSKITQIKQKKTEIWMIFPSHEALVDPSGRADAATVERGGAHRGKDSQPGQECQPTLLERRASFGCPPRRRQTDLLVNESAPSAAEAEASTRVDTGR